MKISKANHLTRLLQAQDVLLAVLVFLVTIQVANFLGHLPRESAVQNLWLTLFVAAAGMIASGIGAPKLHRQSIVAITISVLKFVAITFAGLLIFGFIGNIDSMHRDVLFSYAIVLALVLLFNRAFLIWYYLHGRREVRENFLKVLVVGTGPRAQKLAKAYQEHADWGIEIIGTLDPESTSNGSFRGMSEHRNLGGLAELPAVLSREVVDEVIVCLPRSLINEVEGVVEACEEQAVCLKFMADLYEMNTKQINLDYVGSYPILSFEPVAQDEAKLVVKRVLDLLIILAAIPILIPLFVLLAIVIKMDSRGPVFFVQQRVGLNKRIFPMLKFRSMFSDAEQHLEDVEHLNEANGPIFKIRNDPRVTRVGKFIRRSSIDELPQLINVLLGHMSLVGPRPMSVRDVDKFNKGIQRKRFSVKPGVACLREISGRSKLSFERWLELDLQYIDEWTIGLDLRILFHLIPSVLRGDGAS